MAHPLQSLPGKTGALYEKGAEVVRMQHNLVGTLPEQQGMERLLKAIIQQYMQRMTRDELMYNE